MEKRARLRWLLWAVALAAVVLGLGWQAADADGRIRCVISELDLCAGPLDSSVLPTSIAVGIVLIGIGAWAFLTRPR